MKPEVKYRLIERLIQTEDDDILRKVEAILEKSTELTDEHKKILDERMAEHKANPDDIVDWEEVKAEIENKL